MAKVAEMNETIELSLVGLSLISQSLLETMEVSWEAACQYLALNSH